MANRPSPPKPFHDFGKLIIDGTAASMYTVQMKKWGLMWRTVCSSLSSEISLRDWMLHSKDLWSRCHAHKLKLLANHINTAGISGSPRYELDTACFR